ncbi:ankyrin repeat domain-containing protein [Bacteroides cellulosilyticus]|uniref:ankyrin repeat domain-containing protein n=1 Tax=Bacteroides cellulosilyticus TaxID=246787 RepID=UPI0032EE7898
MKMDVNLIISKIRNLFSYLASTLLLLSCSNMAVKDFKPDTYFSRKVDLEMAMADAIYYGEKKLVRDYINTGRVDINRPGKAGFTFLMYAVYIEQYDVAKVLLENGADPNILSVVTHPDGAVEHLTPLSCVCAHHWYPIKYIKLLAENGADMNDTITAPFLLCIGHSMKDTQKVRYMIEHGANINKEVNGYTPIQYAALVGKLDLVDLLWELGANPLYTTSEGISLAYLIQEDVDKKLGTKEYVSHAQAIMKRLEKLGVKFPVTLNPKDEKEEEADSPISQGKTDENKKE